MGVTYIKYKIAKCDICREEEKFDASYDIPKNWNSLQDTSGAINYSCICPECTKRIRCYIKEFKDIHCKDGA